MPRKRSSSAITRLPRVVAGALAVASLLGLLGLTERRLCDWRDEVSIWRAAVSADPSSPTAHGSLGEALLARRAPGAERQFRTDIAGRPDRLVSRIMLAMALEQRGAHAEAAQEWRVITEMAARRFGPGLDPVVTTRGDRIQGLIVHGSPQDLSRVFLRSGRDAQ